MTTLDWIFFAAYLVVLLGLGLRVAMRGREGTDFLLAGRDLPWWAVGLSVMATQFSAITFIGTTAQGATDGMRFAQFYLGLPVAMLILAFTLLPRLRAARVTTVYELLEQRFDGRVRLATSLLFLVSRSLSLGIVIYAPALVLSLLLGWDTSSTILLVTGVAVAYTLLGGLAAVVWTDVVQMGLMFGGLALCVPALLERLPEGMSLPQAWELAGLSGRTQIIDTTFDAGTKYTVWSGLLGGTLLFLAYFGCDQSQAQRLLAARSLGHARRALALNGIAKVPLQLGVLALGVLLFVVGHEQPPELFLDPRTPARLEAAGPEAQALAAELERDWQQGQAARRDATAAWRAQPDDAAARAGYLAAQAELERITDSAAQLKAGDLQNPLFLNFVLGALPVGLLGLVLAAVFAAAMSSMDSELNALATSSAVDLWARHSAHGDDPAKLVAVTRWATLFWGALAAFVALRAEALGSVIEAVNQLGSLAYGSLLGVFALALGVKSARPRGALLGLALGVSCVGLAQWQGLAWLWLNPLGAGVVISVGCLEARLGAAGTGSGQSAGTA